MGEGESNGGSGKGSSCDSYGPRYGGGPVAKNRLGRKGGLDGHGRTTATVVTVVAVLAAVALPARATARGAEGGRRWQRGEDVHHEAAIMRW